MDEFVQCKLHYFVIKGNQTCFTLKWFKLKNNISSINSIYLSKLYNTQQWQWQLFTQHWQERNQITLHLHYNTSTSWANRLKTNACYLAKSSEAMRATWGIAAISQVDSWLLLLLLVQQQQEENGNAKTVNRQQFHSWFISNTHKHLGLGHFALLTSS